MSGKRKLQVVTDIEGLCNVFPDVVNVEYLNASPGRAMLALFRKPADVVILRLPSKSTALAAFLRSLRPRSRRLVYYDVNVPVAVHTIDRFKRRVYLSLLRQADLILTLHADITRYAELLRMPKERIRYVGFKSNAWEDAAAVARGRQTEDQGTYILACGRSYRDFATFAQALAETDLPGRILFPPGGLGELLREGSLPPRDPLPPNVEIVQHDGTRSSWVDELLGARIVVVPLRADVLQPAGVSVYLEAMNLSRPVVVSEGASSSQMLHNGIAGVVPPGDSRALARELQDLWNDGNERRERIAEAREYVSRLGGVERMSRDILTAAVEDLH